MRRWKKYVTACFAAAVLCLSVTGAAAFETADRAQAAYTAIDTAVAEEFGRNESNQLANYPEGFGGAWLDGENYLIIGLTEEGAEDEAYYEELSGDPEALRFERVKYSLAELLAIQAEIAVTYPTMEQIDFYLEGALINLETNTVELTVMQGGLETAMDYYTGLYGDAVSGVEGQEAIETGTVSEETTRGLVISLPVLIAIVVVIVASAALIVILVVVLVQHLRNRKKLRKEEMEQAAARAARAAKEKKKR